MTDERELPEDNDTANQIVDVTPFCPLAANIYIPEFKYLYLFSGQSRPFYRQQIITDDFMSQNGLLYETIEARTDVLEENGNFAHEYRHGSHIVYRVLQAQARLDNGVPFELTGPILDRYERDIYGDGNYEYMRQLVEEKKFDEAAGFSSELFYRRRPELVFCLEENEPFFMQNVRDNLRTIMPERFEAVLNGVMDTYFPFKTGKAIEAARKIGTSDMR